MRTTLSLLQRVAFVLLLAPVSVLGGACASGTTPEASGDSNVGPDAQDEEGDLPANICLLHNCASDVECGACTDGRNTCNLEEGRCVACDAATGSGCPDGEYCSSYGQCAPDGVTCPTDSHGTPEITCDESADCIACDPMHRVCDIGAGKCVACTPGDTSECQSTDICVDNQCSSRCPTDCDTDNDCSQCGTAGNEAHACNAHKCAECSATYACPAGLSCSPQGVCVALCGSDGDGTCQSDADCESCGADNTSCNVGTCGPSAAGCSDLGQGVAVLPPPFDAVTNLCSNDGDCAGVGAPLNVGKMLRDLTGIDQINDAEIVYGMNVCAAVTIGSGDTSLSCGVCVPCREDSDCNDIDIDQVAGEAFGPVGGIVAAFLLDQIFGQNEHTVHMYCEQVAGDYGVCAPCPGLLYDCGVGGGGQGSSSGGGGGGGTCDHEVCEIGGALDFGCDACTEALCAVDEYCCTTDWDSQCVAEVAQYCEVSCGGGNGGGGPSCHDECTAGDALDPSCSSCVADVCAADSYCCTTSWDAQCVSEVDQYCATSCGGGSSSSSGGGGSCHDVCIEGAALEASCSACAADVCDTDSYCCTTAWDDQCVGLAAQLCGACG